MPNDLATLTSELATSLRDTGHSVWTQAEKQSLVTQAVNRLFPGVLRYATQPLQLTQGVSFIDIGNATYPFYQITRIDVYDSNPDNGTSRMLMEMPGGTWEIQEEMVPGTATRVAFNPNYTLDGSYWLLIHGFVPYNLTTHMIPDYLVPLVISRARAEAYRRMGADRVQFENWLVSNQTQNVSVNELLNLISEAERTAEELERKYTTRYRRPVRARR